VTINYGIYIKSKEPNHKCPKKIRIFKTGKIEIDITVEQWKEDETHKLIREKIKEQEPNLISWHGWCPADESVRLKLNIKGVD